MWGAVNDLLGRGLEALALRQRLLAHNVANAETPGYKRYDVRFAELLADRLHEGRLPLWRTDPAHLPGAPAAPAGAVYREAWTAMRNDGNNVDIDAEMARLAQTAIHYQALVRQLSDRIALLRTVIHEGRR
ncbi:MAG: flagellar basal body rod protein FlgB [Symbiobacteriaceae bacterium]|nr:MAG: flagellar basal body rod protein FlgB [Bacillota bacterium]